MFEQLGQKPQQETRVQPRVVHQLVGSEDIDNAAAVGVGLQQVLDVEHRLAEETVATLLLDLQQAALDRADRRRRNVAVLGPELRGVVADILHDRAQILQVEQQQAVVVGDLEHQREHALLGLVQIKLAREQQRAHVRHRRTYG